METPPSEPNTKPTFEKVRAEFHELYESQETDMKFTFWEFPGIKDIVINNKTNPGATWGIFGPSRSGKSYFSVILFMFLNYRNKAQTMRQCESGDMSDMRHFYARYITNVDLPGSIVPKSSIIHGFKVEDEMKFMLSINQPSKFGYDGVYAIDDYMECGKGGGTITTDFFATLFRTCTGHTNFHAMFINQSVISLPVSARGNIRYLVFFGCKSQQSSHIYTRYLADMMTLEMFKCLVKLQKTIPHSAIILIQDPVNPTVCLYSSDRDEAISDILNGESRVLASAGTRYMIDNFSIAEEEFATQGSIVKSTFDELRSRSDDHVAVPVVKPENECYGD